LPPFSLHDALPIYCSSLQLVDKSYFIGGTKYKKKSHLPLRTKPIILINMDVGCNLICSLHPTSIHKMLDYITYLPQNNSLMRLTPPPQLLLHRQVANKRALPSVFR